MPPHLHFLLIAFYTASLCRAQDGHEHNVKYTSATPEPATSSDEDEPAATVQEVTEATWEHVLATHESIVVLYVLPWCKHCKQFAPMYERVAETVGEKTGGGILFAKCNVDKWRHFLQKYEVKVVPALLAFHNGNVVGRFGENREPHLILKWIYESLDVPHTDADLKFKVKLEDLKEWLKGTIGDSRESSSLILLGLGGGILCLLLLTLVICKCCRRTATVEQKKYQ